MLAYLPGCLRPFRAIHHAQAAPDPFTLWPVSGTLLLSSFTLTRLGRDMTDDMHGDRIRAIRRKLGLSQVQLAELLAVSNVTSSTAGKRTGRNLTGDDRAAGPPGARGALRRTSPWRSYTWGTSSSPCRRWWGERDRERLREVLSEAPLVTVVGAAGAGKTTLALDVAQRVQRDWADGVWFVDLAAITEPDAVPAAVAFALGLRDEGQIPLAARLREVMQERSLLVLLDNCEHVRLAAAALVQEMLAGRGASRVMATSRVALGVPGERVLPLRPLPLAEAAQLFLQRAQEQQPDLLPLDTAAEQAVENICQRLDGLPLAIELAAARARVLSITQIASRLDQRFIFLQAASGTVERQRTLRAAIAWSCDLLLPGRGAALRPWASSLAGVTWRRWNRYPGLAEALDLVDELVQQSMVMGGA